MKSCKTPSEFRQAIALHLFETDRLTEGYASKLAEMSLNAFRQLLKQSHIPLHHYDVEALQLDLQNLQTSGRL